MTFYRRHYIWKDDQKHPLPGNVNGKKEEYTHDMFADFALDFIKRHHDKPFFLYLPYLIPHARYEIPSLSIYRDKEGWTKHEKVHAAMITRVDEDMGDMFELLKKLGIDKNTIVFFTSDNGAAKRWEARFDSSGVLRGKKRNVYEGGLRVPMIVRWPGQIEKSTVSHTPGRFPDVYPTLESLAGAPVSKHVDGVNILPTLLGQKQNLQQRELYWEFFEGKFKQAMRKGQWKAVKYANKPMELYNLAQDLSEQNNISTENTQLVSEFETLFKDQRVPSPHWPSPVD